MGRAAAAPSVGALKEAAAAVIFPLKSHLAAAAAANLPISLLPSPEYTVGNITSNTLQGSGRGERGLYFKSRDARSLRWVSILLGFNFFLYELPIMAVRFDTVATNIEKLSNEEENMGNWEHLATLIQIRDGVWLGRVCGGGSEMSSVGSNRWAGGRPHCQANSRFGRERRKWKISNNKIPFSSLPSFLCDPPFNPTSRVSPSTLHLLNRNPAPMKIAVTCADLSWRHKPKCSTLAKGCEDGFAHRCLRIVSM